MDLVAVLRSYVERMLREVSGIKVLVLDPETTRIVSAVYSQTDILEQDVYLVERLDNDSSEPLKHMKVRPSTSFTVVLSARHPVGVPYPLLMAEDTVTHGGPYCSIACRPCGVDVRIIYCISSTVT